MSSPASIAGHPIHPMLIPIPIGLWVFSLVSDIIYAAGWGSPVWIDVAFYTMAGGVVGALLAAIPGLIDFSSIRDGKTKQIGLVHMIINLAAVVSYCVNLWMRSAAPVDMVLPIVLSIITIVGIGISGWLGGELVYRYGVSVEPQHDSAEQERAKIRRAA